MQKKYKIGLIIIAVLIILVSALGVVSLFWNKDEEQDKNVTNVISKISDYGYTLDDRDTKYMKSTFEELESILAAETINYEEYAKTLAKLFIIDFYTLNNKINKYDVGGSEYIYTEKVEEFKNKAIDTMYSSIIDNTYKDRVQDLPEITEVIVIDISTTTYILNEEEKDAYLVTLKYTYKEDLGYDEKGSIYLINNNGKLEIVNYTPIEE